MTSHQQTVFVLDDPVTRVTEPLSPRAEAYRRWAHCLPHWFASQERVVYDTLLRQREQHITDAIIAREFGRAADAACADVLAETCLQQANGLRANWERRWFAAREEREA